MLRRSFLFLSATALLALTAGPALAVQYTITELGAFGGTSSFSQAYGINESGQVAGYSDNAAFIWTNGTMTSLHNGMECTVGQGINDNGTVVGYLYDYTSGISHTAAISDGINSMQCMLDPSDESDAFAINNDNLVVGMSQWQAYVYDVSNTTMTSLGTLGVLASCMMSQANDINNCDVVVGSGEGMDGDVPFRYSGGVLTDLRTVITGAKTAEAINENGWIVGKANTSNFASGAYLWNGTTSVDLGKTGTYSSVPYDVNDNGLVVGGATDARASDAFLYDSNTATLSKLHDLLDVAGQAGWSKLSYATGINNDGLICGYGLTSDGMTRAFLLTPVPEPSTVALVVLGLVGLLGYAWRKRK